MSTKLIKIMKELLDCAEDLLSELAWHNRGSSEASETDTAPLTKAREAIANAGHWTKTPPTKPGMYRVADREGDEASSLYVCIIDGTLMCPRSHDTLPPSDAWRGWWWSEPIEDLPKPPSWDAE